MDCHCEKPGKTGLGCRLACAILPSCAHCLGSRFLGTRGWGEHSALGSWHTLSP